MKSNTKKTVCLFAVFFLAAVLLTGVQLVGTKVAVAEHRADVLLSRVEKQSHGAEVLQPYARDGKRR